MIKYLKEYRFYIALFLFILIPIVAIDTATRAPRDYRLPDRAIIGLTAPVQSLITWVLDGITAGVQNYLYLWKVRSENTLLLDQNRKFVTQIAALREAELENQRLRKLLQFQTEFSIKTTLARVIAKDVSSDFRSLRINRGANAGIRKNMAVVTHEGVVGRILRTTGDTADIVTVLDFQSSVDIVVERSRVRGIVAGLTEQMCELKYALRTDDIQVGDRLISSGLGGIFPKGVPVGVVAQVNKKAYGISQEVEVTPAVDFARLEEVMVVTQGEYDKLFPAESDGPGTPAPGAAK